MKLLHWTKVKARAISRKTRVERTAYCQNYLRDGDYEQLASQRGIRRKGLGKKQNGEEIGERRDLFFCLSRFSFPPLPSPPLFLRQSGYKNTEDHLLRGARFADRAKTITQLSPVNFDTTYICIFIYLFEIS